MESCEGKICPTDAVFDAAEALARQYPEGNMNAALGAIALSRKALELLRERIVCTGMTQNETNGQFDCPLREGMQGVRSMGVGIWPPNQFRIPLEGAVKKESELSAGPHRGHGTYL